MSLTANRISWKVLLPIQLLCPVAETISVVQNRNKNKNCKISIKISGNSSLVGVRMKTLSAVSIDRMKSARDQVKKKKKKNRTVWKQSKYFFDFLQWKGGRMKHRDKWNKLAVWRRGKSFYLIMYFVSSPIFTSLCTKTFFFFFSMHSHCEQKEWEPLAEGQMM